MLVGMQQPNIHEEVCNGTIIQATHQGRSTRLAKTGNCTTPAAPDAEADTPRAWLGSDPPFPLIHEKHGNLSMRLAEMEIVPSGRAGEKSAVTGMFACHIENTNSIRHSLYTYPTVGVASFCAANVYSLTAKLFMSGAFQK